MSHSKTPIDGQELSLAINIDVEIVYVEIVVCISNCMHIVTFWC